MDRTHDVIIIGGGSAGYAAARTAKDAGADVAIVDQGPLGGLCILRGCMPTKAILRTAEIAALIQRAQEFGLAPAAAKADLKTIIDRKDRLVSEFADYRIGQLRDPRFALYEHHASFLSPHELQAGPFRLTGKAFIIATGSVPREVAIPGLRECGYLTSDDLLDLRDQPSSLIVLGAGPVALELGQFFSRIGTSVTVIQRSPHLLSHLDDDIGTVLKQALEDEGVTVFTDTALTGIRKGVEASRSVSFIHRGEPMTVRGEQVLQAMGRRPCVDDLNLEAADVRVVDGRVVVDGAMRTSQRHIFAVGDVTNLYDIVHIAIQQGELAGFNATHLAEVPRQFDDRLVTEVIFTDPQVALVGLSEKTCRVREIPYLVASYPFSDHGKAMCRGDRYGFVKLLAVPENGQLLGAQIVGPEAGELIHELIAVMYYRGTVYDLMRMPHYHPTLAEIVTYPAEALVERIDKR
ncbi:Dihydrolipoyl dehydrogenase [Nitrospira sp. KM1]|uniref:dihydrolipoyl dehydrogenase family protein n=1 Tax=Nitrospira sp. KM1 TaxID=1936990 RepID=UPI0013A77BDF|nr:FAD-dependent oxidoreductase [Nitrospira sp. KM1]BCA55191.1 Dihydrolipoyl dehydrogenase [Nitrospira sp. KM1]